MQTADQLLKQLEWTVIRRLDGMLQGDYRTLFRGAGLDLADLREYQLHDDVRHIDWNVTARLQVPHVRQFTEDREINAWFLLDLSASIDFGSHTTRKRDVLAQFVGVLARLMTRHGNKVGALLYSSQLDAVIPARGSRLHVLHLLHSLLTPAALTQQKRPSTKHSTHKAPTDLGDLLMGALGHVKRRSLVFVVSDFISTPGWEKPLGQLAQKHEVIAVRLIDPAEQALPDIGLVTLEDPETGEQLFVDMHDKKFRTRFEELAAQNEADIFSSFAKAGVDALELSTDEALVNTIVRFAQMRKQRARGAAGATHSLKEAA
jgi:uncharacterized protein (DUF58 family)